VLIRTFCSISFAFGQHPVNWLREIHDLIGHSPSPAAASTGRVESALATQVHLASLFERQFGPCLDIGSYAPIQLLQLR
jgi:hypothetical protein